MQVHCFFSNNQETTWLRGWLTLVTHQSEKKQVLGGWLQEKKVELEKLPKPSLMT